MPLSGALEQLFEYWNHLPRSNGKLLPARSTLIPTDLHHALPRLSLLKRQHRYQVHVCMIRTTYNSGWQSPFVGINSFDLTSPNMRENTALLYGAVLDHPCGALLTENILNKKGKPRCVHSLYLPLSDRNGDAQYIVGCSVYRRAPRYDNTNEHLVPTHENVLDVKFMDIGAGKPTVVFEKVSLGQRPPLSLHWWDRFIPYWGKPKPDYRQFRNPGDDPAADRGWTDGSLHKSTRNHLDN